jgi:hypothetical protein
MNSLPLFAIAADSRLSRAISPGRFDWSLPATDYATAAPSMSRWSFSIRHFADAFLSAAEPRFHAAAFL